MGTRHLLIILFFIFFEKSYASSCCGAGGSSSQLIVGDNLFEATLTSTLKNNIGETYDDGKSKFNNESVKDYSYLQKIEYKKLLSEKYQGGIGIGFESKKMQKSGKKASDQGLTDLSLSLNYELVSDNSYSEYLPRSFIGLRFNYPFGNNLYNAKKDLNIDVRGNGYRQFGTTLVLIKDKYQLSFLPTYTPKQGNTPNFMSYSIGIQKSLNSNDWDYGLGLKWNYVERKKNISKSIQNFDNNFFINYTLNTNTILGLAYNDNSLLGKSRNSNLAREFSFNLTWQNPL